MFLLRAAVHLHDITNVKHMSDLKTTDKINDSVSILI